IFGVGAVAMTPDTPLLFFWTATVWALARFQASGDGPWLAVAGLLAGFALDSKYTALFLPLGVLIWLLAVPGLRRWLRTGWPWFAALLAALSFAPVIAWNAGHGFASFARQGGRTGAWEPARVLRFLGELIGGQVGLATPLIFLIFAAGIVAAGRAAWREREPGSTLLAALTLPPLAVFIEHALGDRVQGNWPGILYPAAALAGGALSGSFLQRLRMPAVALGLAMTFGGYWHVAVQPLPFAPRIDPVTLRLAGWPEFAREVDALMRREHAAFVAADDYGVAAQLAFYLPAGATVVGAEPRWRLFDLLPARIEGQQGLLLRSTRRDAAVERAGWAALEAIGFVSRLSGGREIEGFRLYRVSGGPAWGGIVALPRP
ncbi:MAG: glycosyltransferase family 39 protein, partial [Alphaproteobacteria bacterium]|nr:glycosyltransferase family 39 protein [Alphaproteobacteria bacterium]